MAASPKALSEISVLIVDDTPLVVTMLSTILMSAGISKIVTAGNIEGAREKLPALLKCPFDVVFLDRYLGAESGLDILSSIRYIDKEVPIVMLTQENGAEKIIETIELGASDYIVKPFAEDTIFKKLEKVLGQPVGDRSKKF